MGKEPCTVDIDAEDLRNIFKELREDNDRYRHYQEILGYIECDTELSMLKTDALLIKAVEKRFGESNTVADIVLMDLGLLEGYNYNVETTITNRREKFLRESDFLIHDDIPYSNAPKNQQKSYQRRLESLENNFLLRLAEFLYRPRNRNNLLRNIEDYIDDGVAILPTPSYISKKPPRKRAMTAVIKYIFSGEEKFSTSQDIVINKNNECEITIELAKGIATRSSTKPFIFFCVLVLCASGLTATLSREHTSNKVQETDMEYQAEESIRKNIENNNFKWDISSNTIDTSNKNGKSSPPFD